MVTNYIGQIYMGGFNFAPRGSVYADGRLMEISANTALFSLYGTYYGGDGRTTFGIPNLSGRAAMSSGTGPGLTPRTIGEIGGHETNTMGIANMPAHTHNLMAAQGTNTGGTADGNALAHETRGSSNIPDIYENGTGSIALHQGVLTTMGSGTSFTNMMPFLTIGFFVAIEGLYPSRS